MGNFAQPQVTQINPLTPYGQRAEGAQSTAAESLLMNPTAWMNVYNQASASPLTGAANDAIARALGQGTGQQAQGVFDLLSGRLQGMGQNGFSELRNPYGDLGAINQGQQVLAAAAPSFAQNYATVSRDLANRAPNRFSGAFVQEGNDLATRALNDFNLFAQQTMQQGINQQLQGQQMGLNFLQGARGLQQEAVNQANQTQLGALGLLGNLAQNAQGANQNWLQSLLGIGNLGVQQQQANVNPILQLLANAFGWRSTPYDTSVGPSGLDRAIDIGKTGATIALMKGK